MAGRVDTVFVQEGDLVAANQVVAEMDQKSLRAQLAQAQAEKARAESAVEAARAQVAQRKADKAMAEATLVQRQSELDLAEKTSQSSRTFKAERAISAQQLDNDHKIGRAHV